MTLYIKRSGFLYSLDTRVKWVGVVVIACVVLSIPIFTWAVYILLFSILTSLAIATQLPLKEVFRRTFLIEIPVLLILLPLPFITETPLFVNFSVWEWSLRISIPELMRIAALMLRSWLLIFSMVIFTMTTAPDVVFSSLTSFGVPSVLINIILLMWRYLSLFMDLAHTMADARALRSISSVKDIHSRLSRTGLNIKYRGAMIGSMFVRAYERSERVYQAMLLRGFDGSVRAIHSSSLQTAHFMQIVFLLLAGFCFIIGAYAIKA